MTLRRNFIFVIILTFLFSCSRQENLKLFIVFDNVDGLTTKSEIKLHGLNIGRVTQLQLLRDKVLVSVILNDTIKLSKTSQFLIQGSDFIGPKFIEVLPDGSAQNFITSGDTIVGVSSRALFNDSTKLQIDTQTVRLLKPLVDTLAGAIRDLGESIKSDNK
jgi:ABC-type transporter Mla subunit MlaD